MKDFDIYLQLVKEIEKNEEDKNISKISDVFSHFLLVENTQESYYFLNYMIEYDLIEPKFVQNTKNQFFIHFIQKGSKDEIKILHDEECNFQDIDYDELSKNDWELHKKLISEGHNPNEILKVIRNDEIEKLQEISSQNNFNFNQTIKPSIYERCSFVNNWVTLIEYAAFFSSVKCFKYLLINGANVENAGKYAIAGGNEEIIHLCEQNHSSFKDAYETAIQFL